MPVNNVKGLLLGGQSTTCSDLVAREIGKFRDNVFSGLATGQIPEHKAYRNTCSF